MKKLFGNIIHLLDREIRKMLVHHLLAIEINSLFVKLMIVLSLNLYGG